MKPLRLPRTLLGAGGIRFINLPGVTYPDAVLNGGPEPGSSSAHPLPAPPPGCVSSAEAAAILGVAPRSARAMLTRRKARRFMVRQPGSRSVCAYWLIKDVVQARDTRAPFVEKVPEKLCGSLEACCILLVARSSLYRYVKQGLLHERRVRRRNATGTRIESYFLRSEVRRLAAQRHAALRRLEQTRHEHLRKLWQLHCERNTPPLPEADDA